MIAKVAAGLLIVACATVLVIPSSRNSPDLKVLIRYDDYSRTSNLAIEEELFEGVGRTGGRTLVGVIPYSGFPYPSSNESPPALTVALGTAKLKHLKEHLDKGDITIALHGYSHQNNARVGAPKSEFNGMSAMSQSRLLGLAKGALETELKRRVDIFVPPWDEYDERLVTTLRQAGIHVLSSDLRHLGPAQDMQYLPGGSIPRRLKLNVSAAIQRNQLDGILVVTVHGYDFTRIGEPPPAWRAEIAQLPVADLLRDLEWVAKQPNVKIVSVDDLRDSEDLSLGRLEANQRLRTSPVVRYAAIPEIFALNPVPGLLYPRSVAVSLIHKQYAAAALLYGGVCLFAFLATRRLRRPHQWRHNSIAVAFVLIAVCTAIYAISRYVPIKLVTVALCLGAILALARQPGARRAAL